jgi:hypothetical protein
MRGSILSLIPELLVNIAHIGKIKKGELGALADFNGQCTN